MHEEQQYLKNLRRELHSSEYSEYSKEYFLREIAVCKRRIAKIRHDLGLPPEEIGDGRK